MIQRKITLLLFIFCNSCVGTKTGPLCQSVYRSETLSHKTKTILCGDGGNIKYRCKKVGDCCEVGKDCEEDIKMKEAK